MLLIFAIKYKMVFKRHVWMWFKRKTRMYVIDP